MGCGANGCELLRNFALMGLSTGKGKIYVIDDSEIKMYNAN